MGPFILNDYSPTVWSLEETLALLLLGMTASSVFCVALLAAALPLQVTPRYVVIDLGPDLVYPSHITNSGYVLGDNHKLSSYVWFRGQTKELKAQNSGDVLSVGEISETGSVTGIETSASRPGNSSDRAYLAKWSGDYAHPKLTVATALTPRTEPDRQSRLSELALPQKDEIIPLSSNSATKWIPAQSRVNEIPEHLVAATQVIGNGSDGGYLWEIKPDQVGPNTFDGPYPINYLLPGGPSESPWNVIHVSSINDGGAIVGTAVYKPTSKNDPVAGGLHGVMLLPLAIVREITIGSGNYGPIVDNGLDDNATIPIYRTESGKGQAETDKRDMLNLVLFQNLSTTSIATMVLQMENKAGDSDEGKLTETAAGSGVFRDATNRVSVTLSPIDQTTRNGGVNKLRLLVDDQKLGFKDRAFTLQESPAASHSFGNVPVAADVILTKPLSESVINTIRIGLMDDMGAIQSDLIETAINSKVFHDDKGTTAVITDYLKGSSGSMNVSITGKSFSTSPFFTTLSETSPTSLQYSSYERIIGDAPVSTPETNGQGIFYIQMAGTTADSITLSIGGNHVTVWARPVQGQPNLLRTGKLVLIANGDPFRAADITTIDVGSDRNSSLELQKFGRTIVR
jgi:hypothetical protein